MPELLSTAIVLEAAAGKAKAVGGLAPVTLMDAICAPAATCACAPGDNLAVHRLLQQAPAGAALVVDAGHRTDTAYFGELMAMDAENRELQGLVIDGPIRDGGAIGVLGFPVFHAGFVATGPVKQEAPSVGEPVNVGGVEVAPGDQVVADSDAVLIVPAADWPAIEAAALELLGREDEIRTHLLRGGRLADILELP